MSLSAPSSSEHRMSVIMGLVLLPWMAAVLYTAGAWAALNFLGYAVLVILAGCGIVTMALPAPDRIQILVLSPALGILAISALTAFWVRLGLPPHLGTGHLAGTDSSRSARSLA